MTDNSKSHLITSIIIACFVIFAILVVKAPIVILVLLALGLAWLGYMVILKSVREVM